MRAIGCGGVLLLAVLSGCGGGAPASPSPAGSSGGTQSSSPLVGTWHATRAEFVNRTNSNVKLEVISLGTALVLTLEASGSYTRTITDPGQAGDRQTGTWSASRDVLTLRPSGVTFTHEFDYALNGNTLALTGGHVEFDFNDDGVQEQAVLNVTLARH